MNTARHFGLRYTKAIDYRDYEPRIEKLPDTHIQENAITHAMSNPIKYNSRYK